MSKGLYRVRVTVDFVNGATCSASIDEGNLSSIREVLEVFERMRIMAERMDPTRQAEQIPQPLRKVHG